MSEERGEAYNQNWPVSFSSFAIIWQYLIDNLPNYSKIFRGKKERAGETLFSARLELEPDGCEILPICAASGHVLYTAILHHSTSRMFQQESKMLLGILLCSIVFYTHLSKDTKSKI